MSQKQDILEYLKAGHAITPIEALQQFGCFRLAAVVFKLKAEGASIDAVMVPRPSGKKPYARYSMPTV